MWLGEIFFKKNECIQKGWIFLFVSFQRISLPKISVHPNHVAFRSTQIIDTAKNVMCLHFLSIPAILQKCVIKTGHWKFFLGNARSRLGTNIFHFQKHLEYFVYNPFPSTSTLHNSAALGNFYFHFYFLFPFLYVL